MGYIKTGFIVSLNDNDNIGVVKELDTQTEWLFFLDEITKEQTQDNDVRINALVTFVKNEDYEQFVAADIKAVYGLNKKAV